MVYVTKADGSKQGFDREKVFRTCLRLHATPERAQQVADKVEEKAYDGISTKKILHLIFHYLSKHEPELKYQIDLREAVSKLRSKPDFEIFVGMLLQEYGYRVLMNQIISGRCVDHEIDVIAVKDPEVMYVEVKHHREQHTYTGLDIFLKANSTYEDLKSGYGKGNNMLEFTRGMVVCNTKVSDLAMRYAKCQGIGHIGWRAPEDRGLEQMIEEKKMYPVTILKELSPTVEAKLGDVGIIILKQLAVKDVKELAKSTGLPRDVIWELVAKAKDILRL